MNILSAHLQGVVDIDHSSYTVFIAPYQPDGQITQARLIIKNGDLTDYENRYQKESMLEDFGIDSYYVVFSSYEKAYDHAHLTVYGKSFAFANIQKQAAKFLKDQEEAADLGDNMHLDELSAQEEKDRAAMRDSTPAYRQINKQ